MQSSYANKEELKDVDDAGAAAAVPAVAAVGALLSGVAVAAIIDPGPSPAAAAAAEGFDATEAVNFDLVVKGVADAAGGG